MTESTLQRMPLEKWISLMSTAAATCVDNIILTVEGDSRRVLLGKRRQPPAQDCLYPIGGLNWKNTFSKDVTSLVVARETGLEVTPIRAFGFYEKLYSQAQHSEISNGLHNNCVAYLVQVTGGQLKSDATHSGFREISLIDEVSLPPYTRTLLEDSQVFTSPIDELLRRPSPADSAVLIHRFLDYRNTDFSPYAFQAESVGARIRT